MANHYYIGAEVRCQGTFQDVDGNVHDPTAVYAKIMDPSGTTSSYQYGVDGELVKSATGIYYVDVDADEAGIWPYRFYATGTGQAASETFFRVEASRF